MTADANVRRRQTLQYGVWNGLLHRGVRNDSRREGILVDSHQKGVWFGFRQGVVRIRARQLGQKSHRHSGGAQGQLGE
jgi:hypothetical protein